MTKKNKTSSWVDRKLTNPKFKTSFLLEYEKISKGEQLAHLTRQLLQKKSVQPPRR